MTIGYRDSSLPFSYLNQLKQPIGYAIDLCREIVDDMAHELGRDELKVDLRACDLGSRFDAVTSGAIDLECGSTTDNLERRKLVDFSPTLLCQRDEAPGPPQFADPLLSRSARQKGCGDGRHHECRCDPPRVRAAQNPGGDRHRP